MGTARCHFAIAWVVLVAQVIAAVLVPSGLLLCREADGSAHLEWVGGHCCSNDGEIASGIWSASESADSRGDACIECVDELVGHVAAVSKSRPTSDPTYHGLFVAATPDAGVPDSLPQGLSAARSPTRAIGEGPPSQVMRTLHATVLIL
ncbi:MAG: hypothetical protein H6811_12260 [Phycisphaeraceae bacterium]|nr:hypothetical protein [Phycisphaeraceae bacterium]